MESSSESLSVTLRVERGVTQDNVLTVAESESVSLRAISQWVMGLREVDCKDTKVSYIGFHKFFSLGDPD